MTFDFETVFRQFGLGKLTAPPQSVTGGYPHRMFRVETSQGKYALKLLFQWTDAKALDQHEIKEEHCRIIGSLLARIHKLPVENTGSDPSRSLAGQFCTDWDRYIRLAEALHSELAGNRELLYQAQQEYNAAIDSVPELIQISNGDAVG